MQSFSVSSKAHFVSEKSVLHILRRCHSVSLSSLSATLYVVVNQGYFGVPTELFTDKLFCNWVVTPVSNHLTELNCIAHGFAYELIPILQVCGYIGRKNGPDEAGPDQLHYKYLILGSRTQDSYWQDGFKLVSLDVSKSIAYSLYNKALFIGFYLVLRYENVKILPSSGSIQVNCCK